MQLSIYAINVSNVMVVGNSAKIDSKNYYCARNERHGIRKRLFFVRLHIGLLMCETECRKIVRQTKDVCHRIKKETI